MQRGEIWWAQLNDSPIGSSPVYRRPVVVVQCEALNQSRLPTVIVVGITGNLDTAQAINNILLQPQDSGLPRESVVNVSQVLTLDRSQMLERVSMLPFEIMFSINSSLRRVLEL
jgi:mRNA interferase MazF